MAIETQIISVLYFFQWKKKKVPLSVGSMDEKEILNVGKEKSYLREWQSIKPDNVIGF